MDLFIVLSVLTSISIGNVLAGCKYDTHTKEYSCGEHGICKEKDVSPNLVFRYCQCEKGYSGIEDCSKPCVDCCEQMEKQCIERRYSSLCKLPRCLYKVLSSRKCPAESASRKRINERIWSYLLFCNKSGA